MGAPAGSGLDGGGGGDEQNDGADGDPRRVHNDADCSGTLRRVWGPSDDLDGPPQALVCAGCGAWRPIDSMDGDRYTTEGK